MYTIYNVLYMYTCTLYVHVYIHVHVQCIYMYIHVVHVLFLSWCQVYSCGNGSGVGKGTTEPRQYTPAIIEHLDQEIIIDIVTGDGHCLALTQRKERSHVI